MFCFTMNYAAMPLQPEDDTYTLCCCRFVALPGVESLGMTLMSCQMVGRYSFS